MSYHTKFVDDSNYKSLNNFLIFLKSIVIDSIIVMNNDENKI